MRLALLHQLAASQWASPEALAQAQWPQLQALLSHARQHSPFHAHRLAGLPAVITPSDWSRIPVLTRQEVQTMGKDIRATLLPPGHGQRSPVFSSGSTGQPVATEQTDLTQLMWDVLTLRDHEWHRRDFQGKLASLRHYPKGFAPGAAGSTGPNWGKATADLIRTGPVTMLDVSADVKAQWAWLRREQPQTLLTHPTVLDALLEGLDGQAPGVPSLREVRTLSEALPEGLRERCRAVLGVPLTDVYSARETGYLALQCPDHDHYHVQSEAVYVEVLRDDGQPCEPGEIGRVVVTPLHNFAFPLIRYELGDHAEWGEPCPCGRGLPVLRRIWGRTRNRLMYPDGRWVWPIVNYRSLRDVAPIRQMRLVQRSPQHIDVELVITPRPTPEVETRLAQCLTRNLGHAFDFQFCYVDHIPRSAGGKFEDVMCAIAPP